MAESDIFALSDGIYSITVSGRMNPAIHHPRWYLAVKLLEIDEVSIAEAAGESKANSAGHPEAGALVCSNVFSQFTFGNYRIMCAQDEWVVMTTEAADLDRAQRICSGVFEALPHTPVSGFAYNFSTHRSAEVEDSGELLAALAERLSIGLSPRGRADAKASSASVRYRLSRNDGDTTAVVEPSVRDPRKFFVSITENYVIQEQGQFDLGPKLQASCSRDMRDAIAWQGEIVAKLTQQWPKVR